MNERIASAIKPIDLKRSYIMLGFIAGMMWMMILQLIGEIIE